MINFGHETEELEFKKSTSEMHDAMKDIVVILIQRQVEGNYGFKMPYGTETF